MATAEREERRGMRIVQYHPRALVGDGGITNSVRSLSTAMAALGASSAIAYSAGGGAPPQGPVQWLPVRHRGVGRVQLPIDLDVAIEGADLLVVNSAWTAHNARAGAVARARNVPYIVADRGAYDPLILRRRQRAKRVWWAAVERRLVLGARALHVFFESQTEALRALGYRVPVVVAPNGVQVPSGRHWDGGSGGYLLYVGRFDPEHKGLDLLVRAVASLPRSRRPAVRLLGPDWRGGKSRLVALVDRLEVADCVHVGPPVYGDEKWGAMTSARAFVYPSRWEGFGNAPAEAAALGVPVLTTPYPLGRYLESHGAGMVVRADVPSIAAGLEALTEAPADLGKRAARLLADEFTWDAVARAWLRQIEPLL
jgi:glycosyltransferase involved in cell wall biosynthesis